MGNVLKHEKQEQIRALGRLGWSMRRIEDATGVRRETVSRHLKAAGIEVRGRRQRRLEADSNAAGCPTTDSEADSNAASYPITDPGPDPRAASQVTTDLERAPAPGWSPMASRCEAFREQIEAAVARGRNAKSIWQELVDEHGFEAGYQSVRRFVHKLRGSVAREAHPTIVTAAGEEAQVDYGTGPMVRHPETGKYRRTRLFALTLGCSRKAVWLLCFKSSSQTWCELHEDAFRRLGGTTRTVVLDNLKEGVLKPDVYDPDLNPLYRDMLAHYGVVALPARVRHPDRKGKVERSVGYAQDTALKGMRFESLKDAQAHLDRWTERWADTRIHGTTKRQVAAMFAEEQPTLQALPVEPFGYFQYGARTVHLDGCVEVDAAYYGAPPGWIGREVAVQWSGNWVRLLDLGTGELLREHRKKPRGWRSVHPSDRPAKTPVTTLQLLARSRGAGASVGALCEEIHKRREQGGVRQIQGVLSLVKKYGDAPIEKACAVALEVGAPNYRFVKKWIDRKPPAPLSLRQVDPLIRELSLYRDLIDSRTETGTQ
ncbi:IS21 family transposase [Engelhardtia mirabilis]|uniref:Integrase core domain protein n=1 Tax=Engelhardtia mirabilis TaxID=2528011 RepID=A0A518BE70_9BACT|nr:Integrase core domain protein [Planctomycetes bacterium Pla133]QDU99431.1 Integrase core domain protein [Planctomycetes bacterium Pla86]QDU65289.1 Integrase core domain protein [Planctomycetes bacterium Pla133]QDU66263.1 Integrase core domain protein [Planctomycetes bacterium Pla133]QDU68200.1 Integrase core domain protein [Planctomycetes bacterium Pla133]